MIDETTYNQIDRLLGKVIASSTKMPPDERAAVTAKLAECGFTRDEINDWQIRKMVSLQIDLDIAQRHAERVSTYARQLTCLMIALSIINLVMAWVNAIMR